MTGIPKARGLTVVKTLAHVRCQLPWGCDCSGGRILQLCKEPGPDCPLRKPSPRDSVVAASRQRDLVQSPTGSAPPPWAKWEEGTVAGGRTVACTAVVGAPHALLCPPQLADQSSVCLFASISYHRRGRPPSQSVSLSLRCSHSPSPAPSSLWISFKRLVDLPKLL